MSVIPGVQGRPIDKVEGKKKWGTPQGKRVAVWIGFFSDYSFIGAFTRPLVFFSFFSKSKNSPLFNIVGTWFSL